MGVSQQDAVPVEFPAVHALLQDFMCSEPWVVLPMGAHALSGACVVGLAFLPRVPFQLSFLFTSASLNTASLDNTHFSYCLCTEKEHFSITLA